MTVCSLVTHTDHRLNFQMDRETDRQTALTFAAAELDISIVRTDEEMAREAIKDAVNELLRNNFDKLVSILYRMDVDERRLKELLKSNPDTDAAIIITDLMIERQLKKIKYRQEFRTDQSQSDEEKW